MTKGGKKWLLSAAMIALIAAISGTLLAWWNPLEKQQLYLSNFLYYERPTSNPVTVISIDGEAVSAIGLGKFNSWCRTYYVPALQKLAEYQPAVVGMDILFLSKSDGLCRDDLEKVLSSTDQGRELQKYVSAENHPADVELAAAMAQVKNLVLAMRVAPDTDQNGAMLGTAAQIQYPLQLFSEAAPKSGHNRIFQNANGLIASLIPAFQRDKEMVLAFPLEIVRLYMGFGESSSLSLPPTQIQLGDQEKALSVPLENYQMLINFSEKTDFKSDRESDPGKSTIIPFLDFLNSGKDYSTLTRDKIVLIGVRFDSSEDKYFTPIDPANKQYGVMIHAQAIQTILDRAWLRNMSFPEQGVVILLLALAAAGLIFRLRISLALPLLAVIVLGYELAAAPLLFRWNGLILNMVYPPLTVILAAIVGYAYRYMTEFRQKTRVAGALGQYVNRDVAEQVLAGRDEHVQAGGGEKREITALFTDIRDFTSISEKLQPQSVVALLNEYFEVMTAEIARFDGILDKYEGDALVAFFEDKAGLEGHAMRAARAALAMRAALPALNEKWSKDAPLPGGEQKPQIDFRVGLSSGEAIVGNIGTTEHVQYTMIGDIVNLGSRLESANKKYHSHIMIAEATYEDIKEVFACRFLDKTRVKGKAQAVATYELLCEHSALSAEQKELIQAYNQALELYFKRDFAGALAALQEKVLKRWPQDYPANYIAGRCEQFKIYPPAADWDFANNMESK